MDEPNSPIAGTPGVDSRTTRTGTGSERAAGSTGPVPPMIPEAIGRYRVSKLLGEGGLGRIYLAHDDDLDRPVARRRPLIIRTDSPVARVGPTTRMSQA